MTVTSDAPTFLVIGAQKSGTTWLYQTLRQHPEIFATTPKGLYFFDNPEHYARGVEWYRQHFAQARGYKAAGEFTPNYFWTTPDRHIDDGLSLPQRIHQLLPEAQIIVAMREPVDRAVSAYYHHVRVGRVHPGQRLLDVMHLHGILSMGFYDEHLSAWLDAYPREQIEVIVYEDDIKRGDKRATLRRLYQRLGVDPQFEARFTSYRYNSRRSHLYMRLKPRSQRLATVADWILPAAIKDHPTWHIPVHDHERQHLARLYKPHNARLAEMLDRDLPW